VAARCTRLPIVYGQPTGERSFINHNVTSSSSCNAMRERVRESGEWLFNNNNSNSNYNTRHSEQYNCTRYTSSLPRVPVYIAANERKPYATRSDPRARANGLYTIIYYIYTRARTRSLFGCMYMFWSAWQPVRQPPDRPTTAGPARDYRTPAPCQDPRDNAKGALEHTLFCPLYFDVYCELWQEFKENNNTIIILCCT